MTPVQVKTAVSLRDDLKLMVENGFVSKEDKPFKSDSGADGIRLVYEKTYPDGYREAQIFYAFKAPKDNELFLSFSLTPTSSEGVASADAIAKSTLIKKK